MADSRRDGGPARRRLHQVPRRRILARARRPVIDVGRGSLRTKATREQPTAAGTLPLISLILVTHTEEPELLACLRSVAASHQLNGQPDPWPVEVIVVDNNPASRLRQTLAEEFPAVRYMMTGANIGFGPANNFGAQHAGGEFLFFLNPDTELEPGVIRQLGLFLQERGRVGVVAPTLYTMDGQRYPDQGSAELTPLTALAAQSIFHRLWPTNPVAQHYWGRWRDFSRPQRLAVIPGTALMVRTSAFRQIQGFDERFFIYFEESDLCRRLRRAGWEVWLIPAARVRHIWHAATRAAKYQRIFLDSRYQYFRKYNGPAVALLVEGMLRLNAQVLLFGLFIMVVILISSTYRRFGAQ